MGKASHHQAGKNRDAVVAAASLLFRQKGVDGVGVRELMASAGLTQGAFVGQFGTKDALAAEACSAAFKGADAGLAEVTSGKASSRTQRIAEYYLAPKIAEHECPMTALSADSRRAASNSRLRETYTKGSTQLARRIVGETPSLERLVLLAALVGAQTLRQASNDEPLTADIISAVIRYSKGIS